MPNFIDLTGQKFGSLTVTARIGSAESKWQVLCDCGTTKTVLGSNLRCGYTTTCGIRLNHIEAKRKTRVVGDVAYIKLTKGFEATVDVQDADLGAFNWIVANANGLQYAFRMMNRKPVFMHRIVAERAGLDIADIGIDHRDCNGLNNRRSNLRTATVAQNARNSRPHRDSSTGIKGIYKTPEGKWGAKIQTDRHRIHVGTFDTKEEAAAARNRAARRLHREFAR